jgi:NYN domain
VPVRSITVSNFLYVDNSNVWIEGMHAAAVENGHAPSIWEAQKNSICDYTWKIDFGKLYQFAGGDRKEVGRAVLYGSRPPKNDSLWAIAEKKGFEVVVYDRNVNNKEKKIDTSIAVSGDRDLVPAVEKVRKRGLKVDVVFWDHAAGELRTAASNFVSLNPHLRLLALR